MVVRKLQCLRSAASSEAINYRPQAQKSSNTELRLPEPADDTPPWFFFTMGGMFHVLKTISFSACTQVTNQPCHDFLPDATLWTILGVPLTLCNFNTVPATVAALYSGLSSSSSSSSSSLLPPSKKGRKEAGSLTLWAWPPPTQLSVISSGLDRSEHTRCPDTVRSGTRWRKESGRQRNPGGNTAIISKCDENIRLNFFYFFIFGLKKKKKKRKKKRKRVSGIKSDAQRERERETPFKLQFFGFGINI